MTTTETIYRNCPDCEARRGLVIEFDRTSREITSIKIAACGTSWHAGIAGEYMLEELAEVPVEVDYASEFRYRKPVLKETDLLLVISQSGETADTIAAMREAKAAGGSDRRRSSLRGIQRRIR